MFICLYSLTFFFIGSSAGNILLPEEEDEQDADPEAGSEEDGEVNEDSEGEVPHTRTGRKRLRVGK